MSTLRILRFLRQSSGGYLLAFVLIAAAAAAALLSAFEPERKARIGLLSFSEETSSENSLQKLMNLWFDKDPSMEVLYRSVQADASVQTHHLENLLADDCQVVIIDRNDFSRDDRAIIAAGAAGVKLLAVNADITGGSYTYLGTNPYDEGYLLGDYLHHRLPHRANLIFITDSDSAFARQQLQGFSESCLLFRPDMKVMTANAKKGTVSGTVEAVEAIFRKNPGFKADAIAAPRLDMALAAKEAVIKSGRPAPLTYCISSEPAATDALNEGTVQAVVGIDQSALAEDAYRMTVDLARGKHVPDKLYIPQLRTAKNSD